MTWLLLVLGASIGLEILGLRWFYRTRAPADVCRCREPWRGEFVANFGHDPEVTRWAPAASRPSARPFLAALGRRRGTATRAVGPRPAPAI